MEILYLEIQSLSRYYNSHLDVVGMMTRRATRLTTTHNTDKGRTVEGGDIYYFTISLYLSPRAIISKWPFCPCPCTGRAGKPRNQVVFLPFLFLNKISADRDICQLSSKKIHVDIEYIKDTRSLRCEGYSQELLH